MQASQLMMGAVHRSAALHLITKAVAVTAGEQSTGRVELGNPSAAIHPIGVDVADEPGPLSAEPAGRPADRHALVDRLPIPPAHLHAVIEINGLPATLDLD